MFALLKPQASRCLSTRPGARKLYPSLSQLDMRSKKLLSLPGGLNSLHCLPISIRHSILRASLQQDHRLARTTPILLLSRSATTDVSPERIVRPLVPPPKEGSGPLLSRRADRELPNINKLSIWWKTLPIFVVLITASSLAIFNYQKSSSSTVNSILYALRTNDHARDILGDEIYFASKVPWIQGTMDQVHGTIDISFWVKGTKTTAQTRFVSLRKRRDAYFETLEWSLTTEDGRVVQLLELEGSRDPMAQERRNSY